MNAVFILGQIWPGRLTEHNKFWVGIEAQRVGLMPQKAGTLVVMRECSSLDQLKASVEQMKHELDVVVAEATYAWENGGAPRM